MSSRPSQPATSKSPVRAPERSRFASALVLLAVLCLWLAMSACHRHPRPHRPGPVHKKKVVVHHNDTRAVKVSRGHRHSDRCGHYRHDGRWFHVKGHVHKKGCGHHLVRGVWVVRS